MVLPHSTIRSRGLSFRSVILCVKFTFILNGEQPHIPLSYFLLMVFYYKTSNIKMWLIFHHFFLSTFLFTFLKLASRSKGLLIAEGCEFSDFGIEFSNFWIFLVYEYIFIQFQIFRIEFGVSNSYFWAIRIILNSFVKFQIF